MDICSTIARLWRITARCAQDCARTRIAPLACLLGSLCITTGAAANHATSLPEDLTDMSLEALMNIEITSVVKRPQKKSEAAAAVFVIKQEDLRRWGVTSIPDALRHVPGLQVARIDAGKWAISSRGFNSRFANKLLVLIDGRSVYTPLFTGVYWEANEVMLEDVERIEVIRGPGGALWGANAVNGVINIITRAARDTQGSLAVAGAGNEERGFASLRHGAATAGGARYRVYGRFRALDTGAPINTGLAQRGAHDDSEFGQTGFRTDWEDARGNAHTLQGDYYEGHAGQELLSAATAPLTLVNDSDYTGGNLLYRKSGTLGAHSDFTLQTYYDFVQLESAALYEHRQTLDIDFQHHLLLRDHHDLMWGLNYRLIHDSTDATLIFSLDPPRRDINLLSAFIQDEIHLFHDHGRLTLGSKFEHSELSGFGAQPNVRVTWLTDTGHTLWGAVSRAIRSPARGEHDVSLMVLPAPTVISGNPGFDSEILSAWELGYRFPVAERMSVDVAAFHNRYTDLRTIENTGTPAVLQFGNNMEGNTQGVEIDLHWQPRDGLDLHANYSRLEINLDLVNGSTDTQSRGAEDVSPAHMANFWMAIDLDHNLELDAGIRYVSALNLDLSAAGLPRIGDYFALDARLGWTPRPGLELSMVGQNLLDDRHPEFNPDFIFTLPSEVERSVYGKLTWKF